MPTEPLRFSEHELHILKCALDVAAIVYEDDADAADDAGQARVREQFKKQAREARALAQKIDDR